MLVPASVTKKNSEIALQNAQMQSVINKIRETVREHVTTELTESTAIVVAMICSCVDRQDFIELLFERNVKNDILKYMDKLKLSLEDFSLLFSDSTGRESLQIANYEKTPGAQAIFSLLKSALVITLCEPGPQEKMTSTFSRVALQFALLRRDDAQECIEIVLGNVVAADNRRIEDLVVKIEDDTCRDLLLLSNAITCLAHVVQNFR